MHLNALNQRLISLDVFRGVTIALMILVNSPGNSTPYCWLEHSAWNGCTLADLVFPFFIVIVGISSVLALTHLKAIGTNRSRLFGKVLQRSGYIFFLGLLLNVIPHFDLSTLRLLGVLQRIAICYFFSSLLFLTMKIQIQAIIMLVLLLGYAPFALDGHLAGTIDRLVFGAAHLYTPTFDPEGLLSTIPAIASVLLGNLIGCCLTSSRTKKQKLQWMSVASLMLILLGWAWGFTLPINKALWSSSYVLFTGGIALLVFSALYFLIEIKHWIRWSTPFDLLGRHALLVYMLHVLFLKIQAVILMHNFAGAVVNFRVYITGVLFQHFTPENAALCYAISYTLLWLLVVKGVEQWQKKYMSTEPESKKMFK